MFFWHSDSGRSTVLKLIVILHNRWWNRRKNTRKETLAVRRKDGVVLQAQVRTEQKKNTQEEIRDQGHLREGRRDQGHEKGEGQGHQWGDQGQEKDILKINTETETEDIDEEFFQSYSELHECNPRSTENKVEGSFRDTLCSINGSDATGLSKPNLKTEECEMRL